MATPAILLIEDSSYLAESLKDALEMHDFEVHVAPNGKTGVRKALEDHPDLILLDIRLPDISGYEVYNQIRADKWGAKALITVLTASESLDNIAKNINLPIEFVLFKPDQSLSDIVNHVKKRVE
jgi:DNA-binding response OmpR family regulator